MNELQSTFLNRAEEEQSKAMNDISDSTRSIISLFLKIGQFEKNMKNFCEWASEASEWTYFIAT